MSSFRHSVALLAGIVAVMMTAGATLPGGLWTVRMYEWPLIVLSALLWGLTAWALLDSEFGEIEPEREYVQEDGTRVMELSGGTILYETPLESIEGTDRSLEDIWRDPPDLELNPSNQDEDDIMTPDDVRTCFQRLDDLRDCARRFLDDLEGFTSGDFQCFGSLDEEEKTVGLYYCADRSGGLELMVVKLEELLSDDPDDRNPRFPSVSDATETVWTGTVEIDEVRSGVEESSLTPLPHYDDD